MDLKVHLEDEKTSRIGFFCYSLGFFAFIMHLNLRIFSFARPRERLQISRLIKGEAVGLSEKYICTKTKKPVHFKSSDKDTFRADNAYLQRQKLEAYKDTSLIRYEKKPTDGATDLFLYDPGISAQANGFVA